MLAATSAACSEGVSVLLWVLALGLGIYGVVRLVQGALILGIVLIILAFLVGPGGVSLFC